MQELQTLRDWLRWAVTRFSGAGLHYGHGCDNAYDEAAWLILHALCLPHERLEHFLDARITAREKLALANLIEQRISRRVPVAYLTREAWLGEFRFYVDERVIVPRSYFANLIESRFEPWVVDPNDIHSVLDLCTGSGCLAILLAHAFPNARVDACDLSAEALSVARRNIDDYGLGEQIQLHRSDLFSSLAGRRYDLIVSNPPYVTQAAMAALPQEYRHEPEMALAAGDDGLDIVRRILADAAQHLNPGGQLLVEVGHNADLVERAWPNAAFTWVDTADGEGKIFRLEADDLDVSS